MTDCQGAKFSIHVPSEWIEDDIPENYSLWHVTGLEQQAGLVMEVHTCQKIALDGKDEGPGSLLIAAIAVATPAEADTSNPVSLYVIEMKTDHSGLLDWMTSLGQPAGLATVQHSLTPFGPPPSPAELVVRIDENGSLIYNARGFPGQIVGEREESYRFYYGKDPAKDFWDSFLIWTGSSDYGGALEMAPGSRIALALGRDGPIPVVAASMTDISRTLTSRATAAS